MSVVDAVDVPFLRLSDPEFLDPLAGGARGAERSWYARTPYGIAVLRYEDVGKVAAATARLRQRSYAWPAHNEVTGKFADWWLRILLNRASAMTMRGCGGSPILLSRRNSLFRCSRNSPELANDIVDQVREKQPLQLRGRILRAVCGAGHLHPARPLIRASGGGSPTLPPTWALALGVNFKQDVEKIDTATAALFRYAHRVIEERRTRLPGDDFISQLLQANEDKGRAQRSGTLRHGRRWPCSAASTRRATSLAWR